MNINCLTGNPKNGNIPPIGFIPATGGGDSIELSQITLFDSRLHTSYF